MKKIVALLLALVMVLSLGACSVEKTAETQAPETQPAATEGTQAAAPEAAGDPVEISLWTYPIGKWTDEATVSALLADFNAAYPNITVKVEYLDYTNGDDKVNTAIEGGQAPDIVMEGPERLIANWGAKGLMVDLKDIVPAGTYDSVLSSCTSADGAVYEMPVCMIAHCMAINRDVFEAADALQYLYEDTHTWNSVEDFFKAVQAVYDAGNEYVGTIYCGGQGGDQGTRALINNLYSDYFVTEDGSSYNINSANNVKALQLLQDMVNNKTMGVSTSYVASDELQAFANGTCAMTFCWNYSNYSQYAAQTQFTPFAMAFPSDDGVPELEMAGPYGLCVFDNGDQAKIDAAKEFVKFVCDDQTAGVEAVKTTGFFPAHEGWGDIYEGDETRAPFSLMSEYLGRYYSLTPGWVAQRALWWPMLQAIMGTGADVQTAADDFVAQANAGMAG